MTARNNDSVTVKNNKLIIHMRNILLTIYIASHFLVFTSSQADWPQWRGPNGQGIDDFSIIPSEWNENKNISWKTEVAGKGGSSPVITGNQVWITTAHETLAPKEERDERLKANTGGQPVVVLSNVRIHAVCIDKNSGKILHDIEVLRKKNPQWVHKTNSYASPTPVIDNDKIYFQNGSYGSACLDLKTLDIVWTNQDLWVMHENGPGGSPIIWNDLLIFHMDGSDNQYIVALDKMTGKVKWRTPRSGKMHSNPQLKKAYGTPAITQINGKDVIFSTAANWLYGYEPSSGKELWKVEYGFLGFSNVPKPVFGDGMVYIGTSFMKPQILALDITKDIPEISWSYKRGVPAVSSPVLVGNELFFVSDSGGVVTCLDSKTGTEHFRERIGGNHSASPTYVSGRILFHSKEGETVAIKPGSEFKILGKNKLSGEHHASAAVSSNSLFLRTDKALYKISNK